MSDKHLPKTTPKPSNVFLSVDQLANRYGVHKASIYRWVKEQSFPALIKLGPNVARWDLADVEQWEELQKKSSKTSHQRKREDANLVKERDMLFAYVQRLRKALSNLARDPHSMAKQGYANSVLSETSDFKIWVEKRNQQKDA